MVAGHYSAQAQRFLRARRGTPSAEGGTAAERDFLEIPVSLDSSAASDWPEMDSIWRAALETAQAGFEPQTWTAFWRVVIDAQSPAIVAAPAWHYGYGRL